MLVVNAWELALKATLRQQRQSISIPKKPGQRYLSISIDDALGRVNAGNMWSGSVDGTATTVNMRALAQYRESGNSPVQRPGARGRDSSYPAAKRSELSRLRAGEVHERSRRLCDLAAPAARRARGRGVDDGGWADRHPEDRSEPDPS
ncbi:hypothetical protein [Rhodococcus sp. MALMAid1271]|uniref:hypothetical protein n=1 Tax=Rhodococcus sp. MALMAid1271 TaxID=3411744 RepID=UPI003BA3C8F2